MIELLKLFAYAMAGLWALVMMSVAMSVLNRRREVRRMHKLREDNSLEFGAIDGPQFKRCKVCGAVRDA